MTDSPLNSLEDALINEVWRQDLRAAQRLLTLGADPNLPGRAWSSAIACAGENDESGDIVRALFAAGANLNIQDEFGLTPLHYAVDVAIDGTIQQDLAKIDWTVVGVLLELGAAPNIPDNRGMRMFDLATAYGINAKRSLDDFIEERNTNSQR